MTHVTAPSEAGPPVLSSHHHIFHRQVEEVEFNAKHLKPSLSEGGVGNGWTHLEPRRLEPQDRDTPPTEVQSIRGDEGQVGGTWPQRNK